MDNSHVTCAILKHVHVFETLIDADVNICHAATFPAIPFLDSCYCLALMTSNVICDERFIAKLQVFMKQLPFLLCGSPGSGKKTSLAFAATKMSKQLALFDLAEISNNQGVQMDKLQQLATQSDNAGLYGNTLEDLPFIVQAAQSRYPVCCDPWDFDTVICISHAKDACQ